MKNRQQQGSGRDRMTWKGGRGADNRSLLPDRVIHRGIRINHRGIRINHREVRIHPMREHREDRQGILVNLRT